MSEKLLEADFLTVDLKAITKKSDPAKVTPKKVAKGSVTPEAQANKLSKAPKQPMVNWGKELKKRLDTNKTLDADARETEYDIELAFFNEFFEAYWGPKSAKQLMNIGAPLRQALKALGGFDEKVNPILGFINNNYVREALIKTGLLNVNTYKAIHAAIARKLVAGSQLFSDNNYNIIYCKDLYTKSASDMLKYLELQKSILKPNAESYSPKDLAQNRRVFFAIKDEVVQLAPEARNDLNKRAAALKNLKSDQLSSAKDPEVKLNSLELANIIENGASGTSGEKQEKVHMTSQSQNNLASKLVRPSEILAAIMHLSTTTNSLQAKKALTSKKFSNIAMHDLVKAMDRLATEDLLPKGQLRTSDADSLVNILLGKL